MLMPKGSGSLSFSVVFPICFGYHFGVPVVRTLDFGVYVGVPLCMELPHDAHINPSKSIYLHRSYTSPYALSPIPSSLNCEALVSWGFREGRHAVKLAMHEKKKGHLPQRDCGPCLCRKLVSPKSNMEPPKGLRYTTVRCLRDILVSMLVSWRAGRE